jgi:hypothetical protein
MARRFLAVLSERIFYHVRTIECTITLAFCGGELSSFPKKSASWKACRHA